MNRRKREITRAIIKSLRETPHNWTFDKYTVNHKQLPIEVWHSNRYYGVRWRYGAICSTQHDVVTSWWLNPWQWWRIDLIRAIEEAQAAQLPEGNI